VVGQRNVLLVEDEQTLRLSMVRGLSKLSGVEVTDAATVKEAKRLIGETRPDLVISDLDLPDGSGIEVATELDRLRIRVPLVYVSAYIGKYRHRLPTRGDVEVYEKPLSLDRLRALVEDKLAMEPDSPASPFAVADYVQLAGMGRHSVVIEVRSPGGRGRLVIKGGEVWSAEDSLGRGMEAFRRLVFLGAAQVTCRTLGRSETPPRDIDGSAESVLLDVARRLDEAERDSSIGGVVDDGWAELFDESPRRRSSHPPRRSSVAPRPSSQRPPPVVPPTARAATLPSMTTTARVFEEAFERGVDALLAKDYSRAYSAFLEAERASPDDRRVAANLTRLRAMGIK